MKRTAGTSMATGTHLISHSFATFVSLLGSCCVALMVSGCDDGSEDRVRMRKACLQHVFDGYKAYATEHGMGPAGIDEFADFVASQGAGNLGETSLLIAGQDVSSETLARLREGDIVVIWSAKLPTEGNNLAWQLLAFEAQCARAGGYLVPADGTIRHVTAKEFSDFREISP